MIIHFGYGPTVVRLDHYPTEALNWAFKVISGNHMPPLIVEPREKCGYSTFCRWVGYYTGNCILGADWAICGPFNSGLKGVRFASLEELGLSNIYYQNQIVIHEAGKHSETIQNQISWVVRGKGGVQFPTL